MAKSKFPLPSKWLFETHLDVHISDINYGGHMGNDAFLRLAHEVRIRFLNKYGFSEKNINGRGLIMSDAAIRFLAEAFHGDTLAIQTGISTFSRTGFDMVYRISRGETQIAHIMTGMIFFDYTTRKVVRIPELFQTKILNHLEG